MASFENLLIGISKGFCTAQDDKIVNAMALTSTNLQSSTFLGNFYFGDCLSEGNIRSGGKGN